MREVAITGLGVCLPSYQSPDDLFQALASGSSLITRDPTLESMGIKDFLSCAVTPDDIATLEAVYPQLVKDNICTSGKLAYHALVSSLAQANYEPHKDNCRKGLFFGVNKTPVSPEYLHNAWQRFDSSNGTFASHDYDPEPFLQQYRPHAIVRMMAQQLAINGPILACSDACAAGSGSVLAGARRIQAGEIDVAFCGAADEGASPVMQLVFSKIGAISRCSYDDASAACRPFDKNRSGTVLGDGAGFLVLEDAERARARGANILAYVKGGYRTSEAYKMTSTKLDGSLYANTMVKALEAAGVSAKDIDHISAHGTATKSNDFAEGHAINRVFGDQVPVTSTKSAIGHSLAGSGAVEAVLSVQSLIKQQLLPTLNYVEQDAEEAAINVVTRSGAANINHVLSNSFGFGGLNTTLILSREKR